MSKFKIFVDGSEGTTGLKINERLSIQPNIEILKIDEELRKDPKERARLLNEADIAFLCLPDAASREAAAMIENKNTALIDASTAFRTDDNWVYGFPELEPGQRDKIKASKRISVPGCYATGFNAIVHPLIKGGYLTTESPLFCHAVSGYTGGGKKLIAKYEGERPIDDDGQQNMRSPQFYSLATFHKHIPEIMKVNGLSIPPVFSPIVSDYRQGMLVALPLQKSLLAKAGSGGEIADYFSQYYHGEQFIRVMPLNGEGCLDGAYLSPTGCNGTNRLDLFVFERETQLTVIARLDNLGKGASGAAIQCMNILIGQAEDTGLSA